MKTSILLLVLIIATFSCKKSVDDSVSDSDENIIKSQVKEVVNTIFKNTDGQWRWIYGVESYGPSV